MGKDKQFTNEELAKKFRNNFVLVNYAISLAENMIKSGRAPRVKSSELQSRAMLVLEEIREGKDQFDEISTQEVESASSSSSSAEFSLEGLMVKNRHQGNQSKQEWKESHSETDEE